jgi:hypothetical protein
VVPAETLACVVATAWGVGGGVDGCACIFPVVARTSIRASKSGAFAIVIAFAVAALADAASAALDGVSDGPDDDEVGVRSDDASAWSDASTATVEAADEALDEVLGADVETAGFSEAATVVSREFARSALRALMFAVSVGSDWAGVSLAEMASKTFPEISLCCPVPFSASPARFAIQFCKRVARADAS